MAGAAAAALVAATQGKARAESFEAMQARIAAAGGPPLSETKAAAQPASTRAAAAAGKDESPAAVAQRRAEFEAAEAKRKEAEAKYDSRVGVRPPPSYFGAAIAQKKASKAEGGAGRICPGDKPCLQGQLGAR